jgi:hypothetical protein
MWQKAQASLRFTESCLSYNMSFPAGRGTYLLITAVPDGFLLSSDSNAYPLIFREHRRAERDIPQGSLLTRRWRKTDSNSRSLREGKGCGQPLQASIAVSDLNL